MGPRRAFHAGEGALCFLLACGVALASDPRCDGVVPLAPLAGSDKAPRETPSVALVMPLTFNRALILFQNKVAAVPRRFAKVVSSYVISLVLAMMSERLPHHIQVFGDTDSVLSSGVATWLRSLHPTGSLVPVVLGGGADPQGEADGCLFLDKDTDPDMVRHLADTMSTKPDPPEK
jgi:hypothetical protein